MLHTCSEKNVRVCTKLIWSAPAPANITGVRLVMGRPILSVICATWVQQLWFMPGTCPVNRLLNFDSCIALFSKVLSWKSMGILCKLYSTYHAWQSLSVGKFCGWSLSHSLPSCRMITCQVYRRFRHRKIESSLLCGGCPQTIGHTSRWIFVEQEHTEEYNRKKDCSRLGKATLIFWISSNAVQLESEFSFSTFTCT